MMLLEPGSIISSNLAIMDIVTFVHTWFMFNSVVIYCKPARLWKSWQVEDQFLVYTEWENPLMGWTSTGDPYANVGDAGLSFDNEEAARSFAQRQQQQQQSAQ